MSTRLTKNDATDAVWPSCTAGLQQFFQTLDVGPGCGLVLRQREDQGDVHIDPGSDDAFDGGDARRSCRNLDHQVGTIRRGEKPFGVGNGAGGVVGQGGADLEAHIPVTAVCSIIQRTQQVGRLPNIFNGEGFIDFVDGPVFTREPLDVLIIVIAARDGLFEYRRVGCDAPHALIN